MVDVKWLLHTPLPALQNALILGLRITISRLVINNKIRPLLEQESARICKIKNSRVKVIFKESLFL